MGDLDKKLTILSNIAHKFNQKNITWAVGASMLLYFKGIATDFHDIDIMVAETDVEILKSIILEFGELQPQVPNPQYKTKHFLEFKVDGVDIDVMAGFTIISGEKEYYFPLKQENVLDYTEINGVKIPLQSLEEWRNYYNLMGRTEKVKMIDNFNL
ncbi:nucleotidyltransferase domain-containing protein [Anaerosporobacter sp.]|uniref:nucleotidyltransferase domain-containing protein n=1 Tax=Anaerosporobacter sp. TaxID=1872529 RepID=UPI00286F945E|nr:hypothetical protein [Anaerosporobacter sp.]